jgi:hypothetical protein
MYSRKWPQGDATIDYLLRKREWLLQRICEAAADGLEDINSRTSPNLLDSRLFKKRDIRGIQGYHLQAQPTCSNKFLNYGLILIPPNNSDIGNDER